MKFSSKPFAIVVGILFFGLGFGLYSYSQTTVWGDPAGPPPDNNVARPVNVSDEFQTKEGGFGLGGWGSIADALNNMFLVVRGSLFVGDDDATLGTRGTILGKYTGSIDNPPAGWNQDQGDILTDGDIYARGTVCDSTGCIGNNHWESTTPGNISNTNSGGVGIGTGDPQADLHVDGDVLVEGKLTTEELELDTLRVQDIIGTKPSGAIDAAWVIDRQELWEQGTHIQTQAVGNSLLLDESPIATDIVESKFITFKGQESIKSVSHDQDGNIYISGETGDNYRFNPNPNRDIFVAKLNDAMELQWVRFASDAPISTPLYNGRFVYGGYIDVHQQTGHVYLTFSNQGPSLLIVYDRDGNIVRERNLHDQVATLWGGGTMTDFKVDASGEFIVRSISHAEIHKFRSDGTLRWQRTIGPSQFAVFAFDKFDNIYVFQAPGATPHSSSSFALQQYTPTGNLANEWFYNGGAGDLNMNSYSGPTVSEMIVNSNNQISVYLANGSHASTGDVGLQFDTAGNFLRWFPAHILPNHLKRHDMIELDSFDSLFALEWVDRSDYGLHALVKYDSLGSKIWQQDFIAPDSGLMLTVNSDDIPYIVDEHLNQLVIKKYSNRGMEFYRSGDYTSVPHDFGGPLNFTQFSAQAELNGGTAVVKLEASNDFFTTNVWERDIVLNNGATNLDLSAILDNAARYVRFSVSFTTPDGSRSPRITALRVGVDSASTQVVDFNGTSIQNVSKLNVNTIDPVYKLDGEFYATYVPDSIGKQVQFIGKGETRGGVFALDFDNTEAESDEWLFYETILQDSIIVSVTPAHLTSISARMEGSKFIVESEDDVAFDYILIAKRFDSSASDKDIHDTPTVYLEPIR